VPRTRQPPSQDELAATIANAKRTWDAETVERRPSSTIDPSRSADAAGLTALTSLRVLREDSQGARGIAVERTLAEGGMGVVKLGTQVAVGREVAIKTLHPGPIDEPEMLRLLREAWVTGSLEHPNIVPIYDVRVDAEGRPLIVLKRIQGVHWGELLSDPDRAKEVLGDSDLFERHLRILIQVANAVHFAHTRDIIHRDLKPENVMVGAFGEVYVLDWGLGVSLVPDPSGRLPLAADATEMAGTPCYMAPEMIGSPHGGPLSVQTDVYLLGAILFEVIEGRPPHDGASIAAILSQLLTAEPKLGRSPSPELAAICMKALARDPADRFESALAFRVALEDFLTHRGSIKLSERATQTLVELREQVAMADPDDAEARAMRIRGSFGAVRFGFRAALEAWPHNPEAERGLREATSLVVEFELANGNPHTARTLLSELGSPPERLAQRVERKLREKDEQDRRRLALERDRDPDIGARTRLSIALILGGVWTVSPLFAWFVLYRQMAPTHEATMAGSAFLLCIVLGLAYWGRQSLSRTALNRGLVACFIFAFVAHVLLEVGAMILGVPEMHAQAFKLFLWFCVLSVGGFAFDRRVLPMAPVLAVAFLVAAARPDWAFLITAVVNLFTTATFAVVWRPRREHGAAPASSKASPPTGSD
jgi:serine/threonine-protein kinase